jgi:hypothetical protein
VNGGQSAERLPSGIGALVDLAWRAYCERFGLYLTLAAASLAACAVAEFAAPPKADPTVHGLILQLVSVFFDAFVVAAVALGVGSYVANERPASKTLLRGALYRWPAVAGALVLVNIVTDYTLPAGGIGQLDDPAYLVLAPVTWLLWGALGLAGPIAALSPDLPAIAAFTAFGRALVLSLRLANIVRLVVVAFATVVPLMLESMLIDALTHRSFPHVEFWAQCPIDCVIVGPLAALQTAFALDFARRIGRLGSSR